MSVDAIRKYIEKEFMSKNLGRMATYETLGRFFSDLTPAGTELRNTPTYLLNERQTQENPYMKDWSAVQKGYDPNNESLGIGEFYGDVGSTEVP